MVRIRWDVQRGGKALRHTAGYCGTVDRWCALARRPGGGGWLFGKKSVETALAFEVPMPQWADHYLLLLIGEGGWEKVSVSFDCMGTPIVKSGSVKRNLAR